MGPNEEQTPKRSEDLYSAEEQGNLDEQSLLEAVLRETMGSSNREALEAVFQVARDSQYPDTSQVAAVEELVRAIMRSRFGSRKFTRRLIHRIACSLIETPEATIRIERLWQEARASG